MSIQTAFTGSTGLCNPKPNLFVVVSLCDSRPGNHSCRYGNDDRNSRFQICNGLYTMFESQLAMYIAFVIRSFFHFFHSHTDTELYHVVFAYLNMKQLGRPKT